jgi:sugar O-acyltransferase (sialic acid O-acetyltransferase NeuD family)
VIVAQTIAYGGGGFGREVAWLAQECGQDVVCFIEDDESRQGRLLNGVPVLSLMEARRRFPAACVVGGVGAPRTREMLMARAAEAGFRFATLVSPHVERSKWLDIGEGTVICSGTILTVNIVLGRHVQLNLDCTVGHDVVMGDCATLAPGVHVSGCVHVGRRVYIGTGAVIINGSQNDALRIGDDAVIGAGAVVTKSVPPNVTVVGIPARPMVRTSAKLQPRPHRVGELARVRRLPSGERMEALSSVWSEEALRDRPLE